MFPIKKDLVSHSHRRFYNCNRRIFKKGEIYKKGIGGNE